MKIVASKRNILIISAIVVIAAIAFAITYIFFRNDLNGNEIYTSLENDCTTSNTGLVCNALLYEVTNSDTDDTCFRLRVVTEDFTLKDVRICQKNKDINWNGSIFVKGKESVVEVSLKFNRLFNRAYYLHQISLKSLEASKASSLLGDLREHGYDTSNTYSENDAQIEEKGYLQSNFVKPLNDLGLRSVTFYNSKIDSINTENGQLNIVFNIEILGANRILKTKATALQLFESSNFVLKDASDISGIKLGQKYMSSFFYLTPDSDESKISEYCDGKDLNSDTMYICKLLESVPLSEKKISDIDEYINNAIESTSEVGIVFDKLVLSALIF